MKVKVGIIGLCLLVTAGSAGAQDWSAGPGGNGRWRERQAVSAPTLRPRAQQSQDDGRNRGRWRDRQADAPYPQPASRGGVGWSPPQRGGEGWRSPPGMRGLLSPVAFGFNGGPPANWRGGDEQEEARKAVREGRQISLGQALDAVRRRTPGHQLDAGMQPGPGGRMVYKVRWATADGRRIDYLVDAQTGQIIGEDR